MHGNNYGVSWQDCFSIEEIKLIHDLAAQQPNTKFKHQGEIVDKDRDLQSVRRSTITWIGNSDSSYWLYKKISDLVLEHNKRRYGFDLVGAQPLQYTQYHEQDQGFYNWHTDIIGVKDQYIRKLSASLILSDCADYAGGRFLTRIDGNAQEIEQKLGRLIIFPSWIPHCVTPVLRGTRNSLVMWFYGNRFK